MPAVSTPAALQSLLGMLLGRAVTVKPATAAAPGANDWVARYATQENVVSAVALTTIPFVAGSGAALAMMPAGIAAEAVKKNSVPENILENWREVMNVLAPLFNEAPPHVKMQSGQPAGKALAEVGDLLKKAVARSDYDVEIAGYGVGRVVLARLT